MKAFWYNPNIHPEGEYLRRLGAVRELQGLWGLDVLYAGGFALETFLERLSGATAEGERCRICYRMRLEETAEAAKRLRMDAFTSTLLVSPYQKFETLVEVARRVEAESGVPFYFKDWREGYREAVRLSRRLGLYRQRYCGCVFSAKEKEAMEKR